MIYLDNAATSHPRPAEVTTAMADYLDTLGASPGRSGHRLAAAAGRLVYQTRKSLAELFNFTDPGRIIFCENATGALNLALQGLLRPGDRVLAGPLEHNAVMRPLRWLETERKITVDILPGSQTTDYDLKALDTWCATRNYRLAVFNHVSNVTGSRAPLEKILPILKKNGIISIIDGAQSAGSLPIDLEQLQPDIFCFTGHKGLYGPPGTGGLFLRPGVDPAPLTLGGTGSRSEEEQQPKFTPDRYEAGTPNTVGLAGLRAGIAFITEIGIATIAAHEMSLATRLRQGLAEIKNLDLLLPKEDDGGTALTSFTISNLTPAEIGYRLDREFSIMTRIGLHCAPRAHMSIGTFPAGCVRLAPGWFNTVAEIDATIAAVAEIAANAK